MTGQIALSAVILRSRGAGRLAMRVCMWTGSIVLLIADLTLSIGKVAFYCGSEVLLGAIIGAVFHWAEAVVVPLVIRPVDPACKWASPLPLNHGYQIASVRFRRIPAVNRAIGKSSEVPQSGHCSSRTLTAQLGGEAAIGNQHQNRSTGDRSSSQTDI